MYYFVQYDQLIPRENHWDMYLQGNQKWITPNEVILILIVYADNIVLGGEGPEEQGNMDIFSTSDKVRDSFQKGIR